jgi:hypothetical protein
MKTSDQLAASCRPPSAFWRHIRQELKAFRGFAALVGILLAASASGKLNNIGRISPSLALDGFWTRHAVFIIAIAAHGLEPTSQLI